MPEFFKAIWEPPRPRSRAPLVELCPCGTGYSFFTLPYVNMTVASDPESSWQVRLKGKTLKALLGDRAAYFGDHVEMSKGGHGLRLDLRRRRCDRDQLRAGRVRRARRTRSCC